MVGDDLEIGEVRGHVVEQDGQGVAGGPQPDGDAGVEEGDDALVLAHLVDRPEPPVIDGAVLGLVELGEL